MSGARWATRSPCASIQSITHESTANGAATNCQATVSNDAPARSSRSAACLCNRVRTECAVAS
jgi:hypothetical protein